MFQGYADALTGREVWTGWSPVDPRGVDYQELDPQPQAPDLVYPIVFSPGITPVAKDPTVQLSIPPQPSPPIRFNEGGKTVSYNGIYSPTNGVTNLGFLGDLGDSLKGMLPLIIMMGMTGGRRGGLFSNPLLLMMLLPMLMPQDSKGNVPIGMLGNANIQEIMSWAFMPKLGSTAALALGGASALIGQQIGKGFSPPRRRARTKVIYRNRYNNWRR